MADMVGGMTLGALWDQLVHSRGAHLFARFIDRQLDEAEFTYAEFDALINRAANLFRSMGIGKGSTVAVQLDNCPEQLACWFGLAKLGAVMVPLNTAYTAQECRYIVDFCDVGHIICDPAYLSCHLGQDGAAGYRGKTIVLARTAIAQAGTELLCECLAEQSEVFAAVDDISSDDPVEIVFTSGTTARPKGVVLTHANAIFSGLFVNWQAAMRPDDIVLSTMPACHVNFQLNALLPVLTAGATIVSVERFSAQRFWGQVVCNQATVIQAIAMMVRTLLLQPVRVGEQRHVVREVLYYLPLSVVDKRAFETRFAVRLLNSYGLSETLTGTITDPPFGQRRWPSIGRAGFGYQARIADKQDRPLPPGECGEIQIYGTPGRTLLKEYYRNSEATVALYTADGWLRTGDLGWMDTDGWFYFTDRMVNVIKRAGENISAIEVEQAIMSHPLVREAAVIGVPDPIRDQAVKAFVILAPGAALTEADVQQHCRAHLAYFKVPSIVEFRDSLPRSTHFKVQKKALG